MAETSEEFGMRCLLAWFDHVESGQATPEEVADHARFLEALKELRESDGGDAAILRA
jgi:hypothetical protein